MTDETPRPDIIVLNAYIRPIQELKRRWKRMTEISDAKSILANADIDICEECQQTMADVIHDEGVAVDAIAASLSILCVSVHKTCYGPRKLKAEDIVKGSCICGAKIVVDGESK